MGRMQQEMRQWNTDQIKDLRNQEKDLQKVQAKGVQCAAAPLCRRPLPEQNMQCRNLFRWGNQNVQQQKILCPEGGQFLKHWLCEHSQVTPSQLPHLQVNTYDGSQSLCRFWPGSTCKTTRNFVKETQKALTDPLQVRFDLWVLIKSIRKSLAPGIFSFSWPYNAMHLLFFPFSADPTEEGQGVILTFSQPMMKVVKRENDILLSMVNLVNKRCKMQIGVCCSMLGIQVRLVGRQLRCLFNGKWRPDTRRGLWLAPSPCECPNPPHSIVEHEPNTTPHW